MSTESRKSGVPSLPLILARELAANLATPMFLIDGDGILVFFNDAAELMIGKRFGEVGPITAADFGTMLDMAYLDGTPMKRRDSPPGVAFNRHEPCHRALLVTTLAGVREQWEVTAYPLFGHVGDMHGVLTV